MQLLERVDPKQLSHLEGVIFDLDDTLLDHGKLLAPSYQALWELRTAGFKLIAATGRPAGWGEVLARMWPVDAVVSENGAIAHLATPRGVQRLDEKSPETRRQLRRKLEDIARSVELAFPSLVRTDDAHARISDVTFDIGERVSLPTESIAAGVAFAESLGAYTSVSSVHLHLTLDRHDKATGCLAVLRDRLGTDTTRALMRFAFIGDSGNDAACFAAFRSSIGVANLKGRPSLPPRYVTHAERGAGFAEAARALLTARSLARPAIS